MQLWRVFPFEYRAVFGPEISQVFRQGLEASRAGGRMAVVKFVLRESAALLWSARREHRLKRQQGRAYLGDTLLNQDRDSLLRQMEYAIAHHDFERARQCAFAEQRLRNA